MESRPGKISLVEIYMSLLKTYSGRDKILRTLGYTAVFISGSFKGKVNKDLQTLALHFGATRTVLRLLDDLPMLLITKASIFAKEPDKLTKVLTVLGNVSILTYFPFEKIAWLTDREILPFDSSYMWWKAGIACWAIFLVFGILRSLRQLQVLGQKKRNLIKAKKLEMPDATSVSTKDIRTCTAGQSREVLNLVKNTCDLVMAVNWLPPGFLWAEKIPASRNAFFGLISSLIGTGMLIADERKQKMA